jgi:hypothetical protein
MAHTGEVRALWIVVAVGCGGGDNADRGDAAPGPLEYTLNTVWAAYPDAPQVSPRPTVYIDGVQTEHATLQFPSVTEALDEPHTFTLQHGDVVVRTFTLRLAHCLHDVPDATMGGAALCAYSYGDLRYAGDHATGPGGHACAADGFCRPECFPGYNTYCDSGERCTSIYGSIDPIATHLGCAPFGTKGIGEACSLATDPAGTHDDCGDDLLCVEGTCRRICDPNAPLPTGCTTCSYVLGHAAEMRVCL